MRGLRNEKLPLRILLGLIVVSSGLIGLFAWQIGRGLQQVVEVSRLQKDLNNLGNGALYQHEAMTTAAQMYTLNGQQAWMDRYQAAHDSLNRNLIDIRLQTPKIFADLNSDLEASSDRLGEIEAASYLLMENNFRLEGLDLLAGQEYLEAKDHFRNNLLDLQTALNKLGTQREHDLHNDLLWHGSVLGLVMLGLLGMWVACLKLLVRWQARMIQATLRGDTAESQLARQKHMLDMIIGHLPVGLFVKNAADNYRYTMCNRKAEELFEISASQLLGRTDFDNFPEHEAQFFRATDERVMGGREVVEVDMEEVTGPRGTWLAHTLKVPIYDEAGQSSMLLGIFEDITAKKQMADERLQAHADELEIKNLALVEARQAAEHAGEVRAAFLDQLEQTLRTPLNGIADAAEKLVKGSPDVDASEQLRIIRQAVGKALLALNQHPDFLGRGTVDNVDVDSQFAEE